MTRTDGTPNTDDIGPIHPTPDHILDAAARYVCRHVPDADGVQTVLAALGLQEASGSQMSSAPSPARCAQLVKPPAGALWTTGFRLSAEGLTMDLSPQQRAPATAATAPGQRPSHHSKETR